MKLVCVCVCVCVCRSCRVRSRAKLFLLLWGGAKLAPCCQGFLELYGWLVVPPELPSLSLSRALSPSLRHVSAGGRRVVGRVALVRVVLA